MFSECSLLHNTLITFNTTAVNEEFVIMVITVLSIGQMMVTILVKFRRIDTHQVEHFIQASQKDV